MRTASSFVTCLLMAITAVAVAAFAQPAAAAAIKGKLGATFSDGYGFTFEFDCQFANGLSGNCAGNFRVAERPTGCSNEVTHNGTILITGLNLSQPGAISGSFVHTEQSFSHVPQPNGTCTVTWTNQQTYTDPFVGTWDGTNASINLVGQENHNGTLYTISGGFTLVAEPVFPMTVSSQIDAATATAQATFQPRPQDAGTSQSVYVFALAPASRVQGVTSTTLKVGTARRTDGLKTDAVPCVLAQLNQAGQLTAATASSLVAYSTGVLSAQGTTVNVLNSVSTPSVAGATMFIGYGANSGAMINGGINRSTVTVPGTVECRPEPPQTGWWWNNVEGGRGYSIERQGNNVFMAAYLYDAGGRATWLVASGPTTLEGALFTAPLYSCSGGVTLAGTYRANTCVTAGNVTLAFNTASRGTMIWPGGTVGIERFDTVPGGLTAQPLPGQPESGWWWNANENGRGFFIEWQGASATVAGYMYDDAGNPIWYIAVTPIILPQLQNGTWLQFSGGQTLTGAYRAPTQVSPGPGTMRIEFSSPTTATMFMPGGRQVALTRFRF